MKFIAISFTLKDQPFDSIRETLERISLNHGAISGNCCLVHGFMPRSVVIEKGFGTEVVDALDALFPFQLNCYVGAPKRITMAQIIKEQKGTVYLVGDIKDGVAEEAALYREATPFVVSLPVSWDGVPGNGVAPAPTKGEGRVRIGFNVSGDSAVDKIKRAGAGLIDFLEEGAIQAKAADQKNAEWKGEVARLFSLAQTSVEEAVMWGVKAATA